MTADTPRLVESIVAAYVDGHRNLMIGEKVAADDPIVARHPELFVDDDLSDAAKKAAQDKFVRDALDRASRNTRAEPATAEPNRWPIRRKA